MRSPHIKSTISGPLRHIKNRIFHYKGPAPLRAIVTAPPRSGTSFLAGLLVQMGLSPGPEKWLKEADEHNPYDTRGDILAWGGRLDQAIAMSDAFHVSEGRRCQWI